MRHVLLVAGLLGLAACKPHNAQADALDNAAAQATPAAAAEMRNQADAIRASGSTAPLADPNAPAQNAMAAAGQAAADAPSSAPGKPAFGTQELVAGDHPTTPGDSREGSPAGNGAGAKPHRAGAPVPKTTKPTPVTNR